MTIREQYRAQRLSVLSGSLQPGMVRWRSPSNIALVKYWGKHGLQLPSNPSLSFTLDKAYSDTRIRYQRKKDLSKDIDLHFTFEGQPEASFEKKIRDYLGQIADIYPFLRQLRLDVDSSNSFPHSTGIASSASGMSALALCFCSIEDRLFSTLGDIHEFRKKASYLARLGSGSACRSIFDTAAFWGQSLLVDGSSDEYAIPVKVHPDFEGFYDSILITHSQKKEVSSRQGHEIMSHHPFAAQRFHQAKTRISELMDAMTEGDMQTFISIVENEALTLHGLMMSSNLSYVLIKPETLALIAEIRKFRVETATPVCFSLDAGPNLHLLYPATVRQKVKAWIEQKLLPYCENGRWIDDKVGSGPQELD